MILFMAWALITFDTENPKYIHEVLGQGNEKTLQLNKAKLAQYKT